VSRSSARYTLTLQLAPTSDLATWCMLCELQDVSLCSECVLSLQWHRVAWQRRAFSHSMRMRCWSCVMTGSSPSFLLHASLCSLTFFGAKRAGAACTPAATAAMQHVATLDTAFSSSSSTMPAPQPARCQPLPLRLLCN
jgi:hypothetical protein